MGFRSYHAKVTAARLLNPSLKKSLWIFPIRDYMVIKFPCCFLTALLLCFYWLYHPTVSWILGIYPSDKGIFQLKEVSPKGDRVSNLLLEIVIWQFFWTSIMWMKHVCTPHLCSVSLLSSLHVHFGCRRADYTLLMTPAACGLGHFSGNCQCPSWAPDFSGREQDPFGHWESAVLFVCPPSFLCTLSPLTGEG